MKVTLISTIKNEREGIDEFLKTVLNQTKKPDEFLIRDGGSTDGTIEVLQKYEKKYKWIKVRERRHTNIAQGRNLLVKDAKNKIIAVTDAGCRLDKNWLKNIVKPFESDDVNVVAGIYKPLKGSKFQNYEGLVLCPLPEEIKTVSRMSSRSLAFTKKAWEKVNGYPEKFDVGEDTLFNIKLQKMGFKLSYARNAIVYWEMRPTWKKLFKQFYRYGTWDRVTRNIFKLKFNLLFTLGFWGVIVLSIIFDLKLLALIPLIFLFDLNKQAWYKILSQKNKIEAFFYSASILFVKRIAYAIGVTLGKAERY